MSPETVLTIAFENGFRPVVDGGRLRLVGGQGAPPALVERLRPVVELHEGAIRRLVLSGWSPRPRVAGAPASTLPPGPAKAPPFDWDAEKAVRELYAINYGVRWCPHAKAAKVFPALRTPVLAASWVRIGPLWPRVAAHVAPRDAEIHAVEYLDEHYPEGHPLRVSLRFECRRWRGADSRWHQEPVAHLFELKPPYGKSQWRYANSGPYWRQLWGRWEEDEGGVLHWLPYGRREASELPKPVPQSELLPW